jgi:hypothetical protein
MFLSYNVPYAFKKKKQKINFQMISFLILFYFPPEEPVESLKSPNIATCMPASPQHLEEVSQ